MSKQKSRMVWIPQGVKLWSSDFIRRVTLTRPLMSLEIEGPLQYGSRWSWVAFQGGMWRVPASDVRPLLEKGEKDDS